MIVMMSCLFSDLLLLLLEMGPCLNLAGFEHATSLVWMGIRRGGQVWHCMMRLELCLGL